MPAPLKLYNTMTRTVEDFKPITPGKVGIYSCGPTVYAYAHIGNMRSFLFADVLRRVFDHFAWDVTHVMNITDVGHLTDDADCGQDKLEVGAKREGLTAWDVAAKFTDAFFEHTKMLGIKRTTVVCKATDFIPEQIEMVGMLAKNGYTYATSDGVYFDTSKFPDYSKLARIDIEGLQEGHRVEQGEKRHKTDFALWKFSKPEDRRAMEWDSPWGRGFPGWHIECSAMARRFLGDQFDIHTGGVDHIPIHHTNEIAQSECATGKRPFVNYWMHGEFLVVEDSEKMSKSLGNILTVASLKEKGFDPLAYRLLVLQSHYRKQLKFSYENLAGAQRGYERLRGLVLKVQEDAGGARFTGVLSTKGQQYLRQFDEALANDLNMPQAVANLFGLLDDVTVSAPEKVSLLATMDKVFGLDYFREREADEGVPENLRVLLGERNQARAAKNWPEADRLRQLIHDHGYEICDSKDGQSSLKRRL